MRKSISKANLFALGFIGLLAFGYGYKHYRRIDFSRNALRQYNKFLLGDVRVPAGGTQSVETGPLQFHIEKVDLGRSTPLSSDVNSNLLLYVQEEEPPQDFKSPQTGVYLRSSAGAYRYIGDSPACLSKDGKVIQAVGSMSSRKILVDGKELKTDKIRDANTSENSHTIFEASNDIFVTTYFIGDREMTWFDSKGQTFTFEKKAELGESAVTKLLRQLGLFEPDNFDFYPESLRMTASGDAYGLVWGTLDPYLSESSRAARLCKLVGNQMVVVPEVKDMKFCSVYCRTNDGVMALNSFVQNTVSTRPVILSKENPTILPIPDGYQYARISAVASDRSGIVEATNSVPYRFERFLWKQNKYYRLEDIPGLKVSGTKLHSPEFHPYKHNVPLDFNRLLLENPMLDDGSFVQFTDERKSRLFLLKCVPNRP